MRRPSLADRGQTRSRPAWAIAVLAVIGAGVTLYQLTRPGLIFGLTPDVAVYVGASVRLVHGFLPYRDYAFVQPPGYVILTAPIGALSEAIGTRNALAVLRLLTPLLAAANVVLVGWLVRHRGVAGTVVACTVMACFPGELYAIRGPQLEPLMTFFCLLGAALVFDGDRFAGPRRMLLGGVGLGFAVAVKLPALIPIAVIMVLAVPALRRRALPFVGGVASGAAVPALPFIVLAPAAFWQDVVSTQVARIPSTGRVSVAGRLGELTGLTGASAESLAIGVSIALAVLVIAAFGASRRRPTLLERFAIGATVIGGVAQFVPAQYYPQYAALMAPFVSLLLGLSVASAAEILRNRSAALAFACLASTALLALQLWHVSGESAPDPAALVDAVIPPGACAISNSPVFLFTANRFQSDVAGCTDLTDPAGTFLALGVTSAESVATWQYAFAHADYVLTDGPITQWGLPVGAHVLAYVAQNFRLVRDRNPYIYVRDGFPSVKSGLQPPPGEVLRSGHNRS
ncbi:MAG: glycosyltransferase 87 family protein [Candidatus Dormibacteraeota bacterium]|nr:glycosyltransferase 87 family protein [Candidatus Dormibacteraeota bacterium]